MLTVSKSLAQWRIVDQRGTYLHVSGDLLVGFVTLCPHNTTS